jgi:signal transduction histidine kinase
MPRAAVVLLIAVALASNIIIGRMPDHWTARPVFDLAVVLFDAAWVTSGLIWAPNVSDDLFLLYFLVIFIAAMGESLLTIVGSAALVGLVYGATLSVHPGGDIRLASAVLLRVPFLFVVALFYGYFVTEIRSGRNEVSEARLREQAKSELLASVSHDVRGPLGNAENLIQLTLDGHAGDQADARLFLLRAQANIRRVSLLVNNLLQAASIESGKLHLQTAPVQLNDIVDDMFNLENGAALLKQVTLRKEIDSALPMIDADFMQVGRIVQNLLDNAVKYTEGGGRAVIRTTHDAASVSISVEDNGPGMHPEQCKELFAPYRRVHLGGYTPGTGLGLYIVKCLAEAQGGSVKVDSVPGSGSTFTVSFPRPVRPQIAPDLRPKHADRHHWLDHLLRHPLPSSRAA